MSLNLTYSFSNIQEFAFKFAKWKNNYLIPGHRQYEQRLSFKKKKIPGISELKFSQR